MDGEQRKMKRTKRRILMWMRALKQSVVWFLQVGYMSIFIDVLRHLQSSTRRDIPFHCCPVAQLRPDASETKDNGLKRIEP